MGGPEASCLCWAVSRHVRYGIQGGQLIRGRDGSQVPSCHWASNPHPGGSHHDSHLSGPMGHAPQPREKKSGSAQASQPGIKLNQPASEKKEEKKRKKGPKIAWRAPKTRPWGKTGREHLLSLCTSITAFTALCPSPSALTHVCVAAIQRLEPPPLLRCTWGYDRETSATGS